MESHCLAFLTCFKDFHNADFPAFSSPFLSLKLPGYLSFKEAEGCMQRPIIAAAGEINYFLASLPSTQAKMRRVGGETGPPVAEGQKLKCIENNVERGDPLEGECVAGGGRGGGED